MAWRGLTTRPPDSWRVQLQRDETEKQSYADTDTDKMSGLEKDAEQAVHHFKIIDYGLANFEETYACGPDLTHDEVALCPQPVHVDRSGPCNRSGICFLC